MSCILNYQEEKPYTGESNGRMWTKPRNCPNLHKTAKTTDVSDNLDPAVAFQAVQKRQRVKNFLIMEI